MADVNGGRKGNGQYKDDQFHAERDDRICRMLSQKKSYAEIALRENVSEMTVRRAEKRGLAATRAKGGKELQATLFLEMEMAKERILQIALNPQARYSNAGKLLHDADQVVELAAWETYLKYVDRQAKLLGADEPRKSVNHQTTLNLNDLQTRVLANAETMAVNLRQRLQLPAAEVVDGQVE